MSKPVAPAFDPADAGPWFLGLLVLAAVAFWPSYLSQLGASTAYTHLHAFTATLWILMLIAQPVAVRTRRMSLHRALGRASYAVVPVVLLSVILLAHSRIAGLEGGAFAGQSYLLYMQVSLAAMFGLCYALALLNRRNMAVHARFMICTAFTLVDPIVVRLLLRADPTPDWNYQWLTFALTDLVILGLVWLERNARGGRWVFPVMLPVFVLSQAPPLLGLTGTRWWQAFARWFAGLPLT